MEGRDEGARIRLSRSTPVRRVWHATGWRTTLFRGRAFDRWCATSARTRSRAGATDGSRLLPQRTPLSSAASSASMMSFDSHTGLPPSDIDGVCPVGITSLYQSGFLLPGPMSTNACSCSTPDSSR